MFLSAPVTVVVTECVQAGMEIDLFGLVSLVFRIQK